jgi:hypothetical protein
MWSLLLLHLEGGVNLDFKIYTFSNPQNIFAQLLSYSASKPYQRYCTKKALENIKRQLETPGKLPTAHL